MKLVNWNLEWANPDYPWGQELKRRLLEPAPDDLSASAVTVLSEIDGDRRLSDHFGIAVELWIVVEPRAKG